MTRHWYNEHDPFAAEWLRNLIRLGQIPEGDVDERSIKEVQPDDLIGYTQCHFFAGIAGWGLAARIAGFPADRELWTGSCPCQPFSNAGQGGGTDDPRHLWPDFFRLIRARRPALVMGEQVASALGRAWFDGVGADLEGEDYACRAVDIPACAVDAPHIRSRLYWIARASGVGQADAGCFAGRPGPGQPGDRPERADLHGAGAMAHPDGGGRAGRPEDSEWNAERRAAAERVDDLEHTPSLGRGEGRPEHELRGGRGTPAGADARAGVALGDACGSGLAIGPFAPEQRGNVWDERPAAGAADPGGGFWSDHEWLVCHDGKARRTVPGLPLLVDGISGRVALGDALPARVSEDEAYHLISRVGAWRGFGNAIVPQLAAEVIAAFLDAEADEQDFFA